jgi:hypothetical protein
MGKINGRGGFPAVGRKRANEVADRSRHVMPFDLEKTTHVFPKAVNGEIKHGVAKD